MNHVSKPVALLAASVILMSGGCGGGAPSVSSSTEEAAVKGTVSVKGKTATTGVVVFDPSNINRKGETGRTATIAADGSFTIKTLVGENMVSVRGPHVEKAGLTQTRKLFDVKSGENTFAIELP
jgi:hypothetical protein